MTTDVLRDILTWGSYTDFQRENLNSWYGHGHTCTYANKHKRWYQHVATPFVRVDESNKTSRESRHQWDKHIVPFFTLEGDLKGVLVVLVKKEKDEESRHKKREVRVICLAYLFFRFFCCLNFFWKSKNKGREKKHHEVIYPPQKSKRKERTRMICWGAGHIREIMYWIFYY